jgi:hypothetical protein
MIINKQDEVEDRYRQSSEFLVAGIIQFTCNSTKFDAE